MTPKSAVTSRSVSDCSAGELLEAAVAVLSGLTMDGLTSGSWKLELYVQDGIVRRLVAHEHRRQVVQSVGREELARRNAA